MTLIRHGIARLLLLALASGLAATPAWPAMAAAQQLFDSPEAAVKALIAALGSNDEAALVAIFGAKHRDLIGSGAADVDRANRARFTRAAGQYQSLYREADGRMTLIVGHEAWPFPIPLVQDKAGWRFDTESGKEEVINRRIGANELQAIEVLRAYPPAQRQFAARPRDGTSVREFARKIRSTPGKQDGLYWAADPAKGEEVSPFGPLISDADIKAARESYRGYRFRILTRQGSAAPAGRYSYIINGRMVAGFAMVAYPAVYGTTGIKTFIVNHYGILYEKDLGPDTSRIAAAMTEYNPGAGWAPVKD
jgi:hypothetical protein